MKHSTLPALAALVLLSLPAAGQAAERAKAKIDCAEAGERYVYDCSIMLMGKKSGEPMTGATIVIGADMPSMAMAHNVKPVTAKPGGMPGMYHARIHLQMHGEWALKLDVSGPTRDRIIHVMRFGGEMHHGSGDMKGEMQKHHGDGGMKHDSGSMGGMKKEK